MIVDIHAVSSQHNDTYTKSTQYASKLYKSSANSTRELIALGQNRYQFLFQS